MFRFLRWSSYRLRTKDLIVIALSVLPLAFFWWTMAAGFLRRDFPTNTTTRNLEVQASLEAVINALLDADAAARDHLLSGNLNALARYQAAVGRVPATLARLNDAVIDPGLRKSLDTLNAVVTDELVILAGLTGHRPPGTRSLSERTALNRSSSNLDRLRGLANTIQRDQTALAEAYDSQIRRSERAVFLILLFGSIVCVGGGVWVALVKASGLTRRISILSKNADRLARGEAIHPLPPGQDELAQLDVQFREAVHLLRLREEQLRQSGQLLDSFFNNLSHDFFCIAGFDGYLKRVNPAWEETLGFSTADVLATPYLEFVHPDDRTRTETAFIRLAKGREIIDLENRFRCQNGSYRWLRWNARPQPSEGRIYASARDVTDKIDLAAALQRRTDELEIANRELEAFSYSVSHDLRAPLRAIDGFSEAIEIDCADRLDDSGRNALRRVRLAARRMGSLIDELLNLSRLTRSELKRQRLDLGVAAESILIDLKRRSPSRDIDVQIEQGLVVHADPQMVRIALENLIHNAWKYTGKTPYPRIEIGSMPNGQARVFHVKDNGAGFDMTYARKLFGAFQRLHSDHEFEGTGVGLAIVQRIVHRHGGRIWANAAVDAGATFYFTLEPEGAEPA